MKSKGVRVGKLHDPDSGEVIDHVVVIVYPAPGSYTGEDMVEICCHGGGYVPLAVLDACRRGGARPAEAGEFTRRAFLNGKMDLVQAEAVAGLIGAKTKRAHRLAVDHLEKSLSREIISLRARLLDILAKMEYDIDFPGDHVLDAAGTRGDVERLISRMNSLVETWKVGSVSMQGVLTVIAGRPNVGKSSLFNMLSRRSRAIVSPHPGTTRDAIEQEIAISGLLVRLVDTAGLRDIRDEIEGMGVEVSRKYLSEADIVLFLIDCTRGRKQEDGRFIKELGGKDLVLVENKIDLLDDRRRRPLGMKSVQVSARTGEGIDELKERILSSVLGGEEDSSAVITTLRQRHALEEAIEGLNRMKEGLENGLGVEYLAEDLKASVRAVEELTGAITSSEVLDAIFSGFCVGK
jgi:tRNA modification GTPase